MTPNNAMIKNESHKTFREAVLEALESPLTACTGARVVQHPITLAWNWFPGDTAAHSEVGGHNVYWRGLVEDGSGELRFAWVSKEAAQRFQATPSEVGVENIIGYIAGRIIEPGEDSFTGYDYEREISALTKQHVKLLNMLIGVLELEDIKEIWAMEQIVDIHGQELFEWVEEYLIDLEDHEISLKSFVNGIRYLIFSKLEGGVLGYGRATSPLISEAMLWRLKCVDVMDDRGAWGLTINRGDATKEEQEIFGEMIRNGITEERIKRLQAIDNIMEE